MMGMFRLHGCISVTDRHYFREIFPYRHRESVMDRSGVVFDIIRVPVRLIQL